MAIDPTANIDRLRITIAGGVIGNAYMNWYFQGITAGNITAVRTFIAAVQSYIPSITTYTLPPNGDTVSPVTGKLVGAWSAGSQQTLTGNSVDSYAGQAGAMVRWRCSAVVDSHRPVGRAILVPLTRSAYGTDGRLSATVSTALGTAAVTFLSGATNFLVWHRPVYEGKPPNRVITRNGSAQQPTSSDVAPALATLRSRNH